MFHCTCEDVRGNGGSPKNISPNGQRTHENMLNIISHRGNANGNPNGILLHSWNGKLPSVGEKPFSFAKSSWVGEVHCVLQNQRKPETVLMGLRIQVNKVALQISRQTSSKFTMPPSYLLSPPPGVVFPHKAMSPSTHEWGGGLYFGFRTKAKGQRVADTAAGLIPKFGELMAMWMVASLTCCMSQNHTKSTSGRLF